MNFNLPYLLQNGMKILNIVNKTLPLVKEFNPAFSYITKKFKNLNIENHTNILPNKEVIKKEVNKLQNQTYNNNTLTFFK